MTAARKIPVALDEELIQRARDADPAGSGRSDVEVIERALTRYLARQALDEAHAVGTLEPDEADRVAIEETHAVRRARRQAA